MKKLIYGVSFLALVGMIVFGCQKENDNPVVLPNDQKVTQNGTGKVDPIEFGRFHNEYLIAAIENSFNDESLSKKEALILVDIPDLTEEEQSIIIDHFSYLSEQEMKSKTFEYFVNPKAKEYYNEAESILDNALDYDDLNHKLDLIAENINENLRNTDWDIVMVYLETIRASAHVWFSEERGGSGIGYKYAQTSPSHMSKKRPSWVSADGRGAGYGMATWGLSGLFVGGPVGGVAGFLYGAVAGAVFSSLDSSKYG
jgi:hypothetical protein